MDEKQQLKQYVGKLIDIDDKCQELKEQLVYYRDERAQIEEKINSLLTSLNMENKTFMLNDRKIQQKRQVQYQSLSMNYIKGCMENYLDDDTIQKVLEAIKMNRSVKEKMEIKIQNS
jgi:hypothetical protein